MMENLFVKIINLRHLKTIETSRKQFVNFLDKKVQLILGHLVKHF